MSDSPADQQEHTRHSALAQLLQAKRESDRRNYPAKHAILRQLIAARPQDFFIDSELPGGIVGVTHPATGFKIHLPTVAIPATVQLLRKASAAATHLLPIQLLRLQREKAAWDLAPHWEDFLARRYAQPGTVGSTYLGPCEHLLRVKQAARTALAHCELALYLNLDTDQLHLCKPEERPPDHGKAAWVLIKSAWSPTLRGFTDLAALTPGPVNEWHGGPRPLAATLLGGLAGAGLGYVGGSLAEAVLPSKHFDRGKLRKVLALLGAGVGAAPGAMWGAYSMANHGPKGWLMSWPHGDDTPVPEASNPHFTNWDPAPLRKASSAGGLFPGDDGEVAIDVGDWEHAVWRPADPFTSVPLRAAAVGLVDAASLSRGGSAVVWPADIARVAVGMGTGLAAGWAAGKVLAALSGLKPDAQEALQRAGTWAGVLKAVVPGIVG